jgi:hypothetical protein
VRIEPVFSVDLEKVWLGDRPILFKGTLKDIATFDAENYRVVLAHSPLSSSCVILADLRVSLRCPKPAIDTFLAANPKLRSNLLAQVAVVADINEITTSSVQDEEGGVSDVRVGLGTCRDLADIAVY